MKKKFSLVAIVSISGCLLIVLGGWLGFQLFQTTYLDAISRPQTAFPLKLKWKMELGNSSYQSPAYQTGLVVIPVDDKSGRYWYGLNASSGEVVWSQSIKKTVFRHCLTPKYLVLASPWSFMTLNTQTGEIIWTAERSYAATCSKDTVFLSGVPRDSIEALDIGTGQRLWESTNPRKSFFGLIYDFETDILLADESNVPGDMYTIAPESGLLETSFSKVAYAPMDGDRSRGPMYLIDRGDLFVDGTVLNALTGQIIHKEEQFNANVPPRVTDNAMYLSAWFDGVVAFDRLGYNVKWIYPAPERNDSSETHTLSQVAILDAIGYVIFSDATVRTFDLETGKELGYWQPNEDSLRDWSVCTYPSPRFGCDESARAGLTVSDDTLFVSFGDGKLYAFNK